jgi:hypothetical protein
VTDEPRPATPDPAAPRPPRRLRRTVGAVGASALTVTGIVVFGLGLGGGVAQAATAQGCDDGPWTLGDISVQGRPDQFEPGARGRTFVWHDADGWHLRSTDATPGPHHYTGTITPSAGATLVDIRPVRLDPQDRFVVEQDGLHYSFTTHEGVDGVDFRVTGCHRSAPESLTFTLHKDGHGDDPQLIDVGDKGRHPDTDPFTVRRAG